MRVRSPETNTTVQIAAKCVLISVANLLLNMTVTKKVIAFLISYSIFVAKPHLKVPVE